MNDVKISEQYLSHHISSSSISSVGDGGQGCIVTVGKKVDEEEKVKVESYNVIGILQRGTCNIFVCTMRHTHTMYVYMYGF